MRGFPQYSLPVSRTSWYITKFGDAIIFANGEHPPMVLREDGALETLVPPEDIKPAVSSRGLPGEL